MDFLVEIELWEDLSGVSPVGEFLKDISDTHVKSWVVKKTDHFRKYTLRQFLNTSHIVPIEGVSYRERLYELRYASSGPRNFRATCIIWNRTLIVLEMFQGSGSNGKVLKYVPISIQRADSWIERHS